MLSKKVFIKAAPSYATQDDPYEIGTNTVSTAAGLSRLRKFSTNPFDHTADIEIMDEKTLKQWLQEALDDEKRESPANTLDSSTTSDTDSEKLKSKPSKTVRRLQSLKSFTRVLSIRRGRKPE